MTPENQPILREIEEGHLDADLFEIKSAIERRIAVVLSPKGGAFAPGTRVRFKDHIRPAKLAGRTAVVVHQNGRGRNRIVVDLEQPIDRWSKDVRCSPDHIEPLAA